MLTKPWIIASCPLCYNEFKNEINWYISKRTGVEFIVKDKPYLLYMNENPSLMSKMINRFRMKLNLEDIDKIRDLTDEKLKVVVPEDMKTERVATPDLKGVFFSPQGAREHECILYLHGGAYCFGSGTYMEMNGIKYAEAFGIRTFALDYRLAPEHRFPAALDDAVSAYRYLLSRGYEARRIVVVGESAGGGLAFSLVQKLRQMMLEIPCAVVALSPWTDLAARGESHTFNQENDIVFGMDRPTQVLTDFAAAYADEEQLMNPLVSPRYGEFHGFPPTLVIVGDKELLLSDSVDCAEKAFEQGVQVELQVWHQMYHAFPVLPPLDRKLPESRRAMQYITHFVDLQLRSRELEGR
jgi:acetyl esterase/lipase